MISNKLKQAIDTYVQGAKSDGVYSSVEVAISGIREYLSEISGKNKHPIDNVRWVNVDDVIANDYNPNSVAKKEMQLLLKSIEEDGYTQPIVVVFDKDIGKYVIVDGFHRTLVMKSYKHIRSSTNGKLPVVILDKDISNRMAATVRHNRARGTHSVVSMSEMVFELLDKGWDESMIANELGMEAEEVVRLKHITGFSALFKDTEYSKAWITKNQLLVQKEEIKVNKNGFKG